MNQLAGLSANNFPYIMYTLLKQNPGSWKNYLLSSYYWRFKGNAREAIGEWLGRGSHEGQLNVFESPECARRAVHLAPRKFKGLTTHPLTPSI
jgi:hypothetical protein